MRFCKYVMFTFATSMSIKYDYVANISLCNIFTQDADVCTYENKWKLKKTSCKYMCIVYY
jgi:hypothetical protein